MMNLMRLHAQKSLLLKYLNLLRKNRDLLKLNLYKKLLIVVFATTHSTVFSAENPLAHENFMVATTIDFLDYCFFDTAAVKEGYLPLEIYENYLKQLADAGVKKLYLRVNVRGLTLYPTEVTFQYGEEGRFHWQVPEKAARLIETLKRYNPCTETIRIGHKYGMEVWAWESLWEDGGAGWVGFIPQDPQNPKYLEYLELAKQCRYDAMTNPFFIKHPEYFSLRDPKLWDRQKMEELNREARALLPISKIVMIDRVKGRKPVRIKAEDIQILLSDNNDIFVPYEKDFYFEASKTSDGFNRIVIDNLEINKPYVKLSLKKTFSKEASDVTMALSSRERHGQHLIYNSAGQLIPTLWTVDTKSPITPLSFSESLSEAWDYGNRSLGFCVGASDPSLYWEGVAELTIPAVREHKLARFAELARYPFDGFIFNLRTHAWADGASETYGYNEEVRAQYLDRYGVDIWTQAADLDKLHALRMESLAVLLRGCKEAASKRPLYISGLPPHDWTAMPGTPSVSQFMYRRFLHLPLPYRQFFRDGSVDGVIMVRYDFSNYFTSEITGGHPVKLGIFRELSHLTSGSSQYVSSEYNMRRDFTEISTNPKLSEVELYEALILTQKPEVLKIISDLTNSTTGKRITEK